MQESLSTNKIDSFLRHLFHDEFANGKNPEVVKLPFIMQVSDFEVDLTGIEDFDELYRFSEHIGGFGTLEAIEILSEKSEVVYIESSIHDWDEDESY